MRKQQLLKAHNRVAILNVVRQHGAISRADVARQTGLSAGSVTGLTRELIEDRLIYEKQEGNSQGGRKPILLALQPHGAHVVGLKLADEYITFALTNLDAEVIERISISTLGRSPDAVAEQVADGIRKLLKNAQAQESGILGIGIGMAGIVDAKNGICRSSPIFGWKNIPFAELVARRTKYPVYIDNDVNTLTLVEKLYGAGSGVDHFLTVTVGRGVGLGIVINGQLYRGMGGAGELGHIVIDPDGYVCECGKRGCLETFVGDPWLLRHAADRGRPLSTIEGFSYAASTGDKAVLEVLEQAGKVLGKGIAMLVNVLNPQLLIVSGEGLRYGKDDHLLLNPMRESLAASAIGDMVKSLRVETKLLGKDAWARGAASLVLQELFRIQRHDLQLDGAG